MLATMIMDVPIPSRMMERVENKWSWRDRDPSELVCTPLFPAKENEKVTTMRLAVKLRLFESLS